MDFQVTSGDFDRGHLSERDCRLTLRSIDVIVDVMSVTNISHSSRTL
jgi:hypothetical protein